MPSPVAILIPPTLPTPQPTVAADRVATQADTFGAALSRAVAGGTPPTGGNVDLPEEDPNLTADTQDTAAAALAAGLLFAIPTSIQTTPATPAVASNAQAGIATTVAGAAANVGVSQASPVILPANISVGPPATAVESAVATTVLTDVVPPTQTNPTTVPVPAAEVTDLAATVPTPAAPAPGSPSLGRTPTLPAQAPFVTDMIQRPPVPPAAPDGVPAPVAATESVAALPEARVGDRPNSTGDRLAAMVSAAGTIGPAQPPAPNGPFPTVLGQTVAAPGPVRTSPAAPPVTVTAAPQAPGAGSGLPMIGAATGMIVSRPVGIAPPEPTHRTEDAASSPPAALGQFALPAAPAPGTPAAVPDVKAPAASPAVQVADGVVAHVRALDRDGTVEFRMRLDPPELGRVHVQLYSAGDQVHGRVVVADDAVRQMIESQLPELRQRLEAAGVNLQRFDVTSDPGGRGNGQAYRQNGPTPWEVSPESRPVPTPRPRPPGRVAGASELDVMV